MNNDVMFSSKNQAWSTRWSDFYKWNDRFDFDLDVCAGNNDQKCERYFTPADNGLKQSWANSTFFCNPPYGREYPKWVKYGLNQTGLNGVFLIPARTDTNLFHDYLLPAQEAGYVDIEFIKGRLTFGSNKYWHWVWEQSHLNGKPNSLYKKYGKMNSAPFPSMLIKLGKCKDQ